jgi:hypothetical protein
MTLLIKRAAVHDGMDVLIAAEDDEQIADHGGLALVFSIVILRIDET